jgi:hypothetical protein
MISLPKVNSMPVLLVLIYYPNCLLAYSIVTANILFKVVQNASNLRCVLTIKDNALE